MRTAFIRSIGGFRFAPLILLVLGFGCDLLTGPEKKEICSAQSEIPKAECRALAALYESTNGPGWRNSIGWVDSKTPCSWHGVTCEGGSVSHLYLVSNELTGPISSELGNLRGLQSLDLAGNQLTGVIPSELGNLSDLQYLDLFDNQLTGTIPSELGNLTNLTYLRLARNPLGGTIPVELGSLSNLEYLHFNESQLTGAIPAEIGNLMNLRGMYLQGNQLSEVVPLAVAQRGGIIQGSIGADQCKYVPPGN